MAKTSPINDATASAISAISKDPEKTPDQAKNDAINDSIVNSVVEGLKAGGFQDAYAHDQVSGFARDKASQYDIGYTKAQGDLEKYRAGQQSGWDQLGNRAVRFVPNVALGVTELAGHIIDMPEQIWGMITGGQGFGGEANDFDNAISKWARETSEDFNSNFVNYRKNSDQVFDWSDPAAYIDAGFDTAESITEFMLTGFGTAKTLGAASKLVGRGAKAMMNLDMLGAGVKAAERAGKLANSAVTSSSVASLNAAQTYKAIYDHAMDSVKDDGSAYTEEEAKEIASVNAADTYRSTLLTATALNYTSLAPFAAKRSPQIKLTGKQSTIATRKEALKKSLKDREGVANGESATRWYRKQLNPGSVAGEMLQEGVEEVTENVSQDLATIGAKRQMGQSPESFNLFSAENSMAFTLGALGGGMAKGIGSAYKKATGQNNEQGEYEQYVLSQIQALETHENLSQRINTLKSQDASKMTPEEYTSTINEIYASEAGMVANAVRNGLDDGTVAIMEMDIDNLIATEDGTPEADLIDKPRLRFLKETISKHRKMIARMSEDPTDASIQGQLIQSSIESDLISYHTNKSRAQYTESLSDTNYKGSDIEAADKINKIAAYEKAKADGDLTDTQETELKLMQDELAAMDLSTAKKAKLENTKLQTMASTVLEFQKFEEESAENVEKLSNSKIAEEHLETMINKNAKEQIEVQLAKDASKNLEALDLIIANSNDVVAIEAALNRAKASAQSKIIAKDPKLKAAMDATIEASEKIANEKIKKIKNDNGIRTDVSEADPNLKRIAEKIANGEELTKDESFEFSLNKEEVTKLSGMIKYLAELDAAQAEDPSAEQAGEAIPGENTTPEVSTADIETPEGLEDLTVFSGVSDPNTPASDKVSTEMSEVRTPDDITHEDDLAAKKIFDAATETKKDKKKKRPWVEDKDPYPHRMTNPEYQQLINLGYRPEQIDGMTSEHIKYALSQQLANTTKTGKKKKKTVPAPAPTVEERKESDLPISDGEFVAYQRQIKYYFFLDKDGNKIKDDKQHNEAAREYLKELQLLQKNNRNTVWDDKKVFLIISELQKVERGEQTRVWLPKLTDGSAGLGIQFEVNDDLYFVDDNGKKVHVPVTDIFESEGGQLLINTPAVNTNQLLEIEYGHDWKYFNEEGKEPILIYRVDENGKRLSDRPIAEVPFDNVEPGSFVDQIRKTILADKSRKISTVVSFKSNGEIITEIDKNGLPQFNSISAASNSTMPLTIGIVSSDGRIETPNRVKTRYKTAENERIAQLNKMDLGKAKGKHVAGTTSVLTVSASGKLIPTHIRPRQISPEVSAVLTGKGEASGGLKNIAEILHNRSVKDVGGSTPGVSNLKKIVPLNSINEDEIDISLMESIENPSRVFYATANSIIWKDEATGDFIRVDTTVKKTNSKTGENFVSNPLNQMLNGKVFGYQRYELKNGKYQKKVAVNLTDKTKVYHLLKPKVGSSEYQSIVDSLNNRVSKMNYNIHDKSVNNPGEFTDAWGKPTGMTYNEYVDKKALAGTPMTNAPVKIHRAIIRVRLNNENSNTNPNTDQIKTEPASSPEAVRIQINENDAAEDAVDNLPKPSEDNPVPDKAGARPLTAREIAARIIAQNSPKTRLYREVKGMHRLTQKEVDWLIEAVGEDYVNLIKGVDRVMTVGGKEAFGWYHQSMITLAANAETGSGYHEAFHFVFNMALNGKQRNRILRDAAKQYGSGTELELEEKLAEDFRAYMLEPTKKDRRSSIKRLFDDLIAYIENILGLDPSRDANNRTKAIGSLFSSMDTGRWKSEYKSQFGKQLQPVNPLFRTVGNLTPADQTAMISTAGTEIINEAMLAASRHETFSDVISNKKRFKGIVQSIHNKFEQKYTDGHANAIRIKEAIDNGHTPSYEEAIALHQDTTFADVLRNWNHTEEQKAELNPPMTFEEELINSMSNWGMQVQIETTLIEDTTTKTADPNNPDGLIIGKDTSNDGGENDIDDMPGGEEQSPQLHLHNQESLLKSPKDTMTKELTLALSTLAVPALDGNNKPIMNEDGSYETVNNIFDSPTYFNMSEAFDNIKNVLVDKPPEEIMGVIDRQAAAGNPLFIAVQLKMNQELSKDTQSKKRFDSFISSFMSTLNNAKYDLVTMRSAKITETGVPQLIFANKAAAHNVVNNQWKSNANTIGIVDHEMNAKIIDGVNVWDAISDSFEADIAILPDKPAEDDPSYVLYETEVIRILKKHLSVIGLEVTDAMLIEAKEDINGTISDLLFGTYQPSLQTIIKRGKRGAEKPFGKEALMNIFSIPYSKSRMDISGSSAMINGKNFNAINMPSNFTDTLADIKSKNGTIINDLYEDGFYVPDPKKPHLMNLFLEYISDPENTKEMAVTQFQDWKDGKDSKEYIDTNFEDSLMQKIAAANYSAESNYFSVGTLSDKLKSQGLRLPVSTDITGAKLKLKDVYVRTMYQEMTRIRKYKESAEFRKRYSKKGGEFVYLPELNRIPELTALINTKSITPEAFNKVFRDKVLPAISTKIDQDLSTQMDKLVDNKILVKKGKVYTLAKNGQQHLGLTGEAGAEAVAKFIIEDGMWKMETSKVLMGDLAKYDGYWDYFKRMYQIVTPGRKAYVNKDVQNASSKTTMTRLNINTPHSFIDKDSIIAIADNILTDATDKANATKYLTEIMDEREPQVNEGENPKPLREPQLLNIIQKIAASNIPNSARVANAVFSAYKYRSNNRGDAQTFVSIEFFRDQKKGLGTWSKHYEWIYHAAWKKGISVEDATKHMSEEDQTFYKNKETSLTADSLKPFYYGSRLETIVDGDKTYKNVLQEQYKESMSPILPIWAKNVSGFDWMLEQFGNGVDAISTSDTVKVGEFDSIDMPTPNADGTINYPTKEQIAKGIREGIPTKNLRYPQVPAKMKDHAIAGTQLQKIIMSNLISGNKYIVDGKEYSAVEITKLYNDAFARKIKLSRDKVAKELNIDSLEDASEIDQMSGEDKLLFLKKLRNIVKESVISEKKSRNLTEALDIITTGDQQFDFSLGMSFDPYSRQYQNLVSSLTSNNILKQQIAGGAMINMADLSVKPNDQLKFIRKDPETGRILPAEIAMPLAKTVEIGVGWGINSQKKGMLHLPTVDKSGNIIRERLTKDQKLSLEIVVYRIPTQMKSSAVPAVVTRVLPSSDGAKMMIPGEMTTQAGLDFDFDKSFMIMRTQDGKPADNNIDTMTPGQIDNTIFNVHWSVLTDPGHFEEMVSPVSSKTHDQLLKILPADPGSQVDTTNIFSSVSNIEMEGLAKYSHIMRGTFSKFAGGHNVMNSLATVANAEEGGSIKRWIRVRQPVLIESGEKAYSYDEFGRARDSSGIYISENHSENLNSALDSQKDPKLGKLNTSVFNSFATGYMTDLGVPEMTVKKFMNSEIMRKMSRKYFELGGTPDVIYDAANAVMSDNGSLSMYFDQGRARKKIEEADRGKMMKLRESQLTGSQSSAVDVEIVLQFLSYHKAGGMVSKLNDMLSPETQKISDAAGIRSWDTKKELVLNDKDSIWVDPALFTSNKSPLSKIAAYHEQGMAYQKQLMSGLFPYFSPMYDTLITLIKDEQKTETYTDWKINDILHSIVDSVVLSTVATNMDLDILDMASPGFRNRISLIQGDKKPTIVDKYDELLAKYPHLSTNTFIAGLNKDEYNYRNATQLLLFPNISDNNEAENAKAAFEQLLEGYDGIDPYADNAEIKQFAKDFVAYTLGTSGFTKNSHSAIMIFPTEVWVDNGIADLRRSANDLARGTMIFPGYDDGMIEAILRHVGPTSTLVPNVPMKHATIQERTFQGKTVSTILLGEKNKLFSKKKQPFSPLIIKKYNPETRSYQLYKKEPSISYGNGSVTYIAVDSFGEVNRSHELFDVGTYTEYAPSKFQSPITESEDFQSMLDQMVIEEQMSMMHSPEALAQSDSGLYSTTDIEGEQEGLVIKPANSVDNKAALKGRMSNKYIGFAEGIKGSSTGNYAAQVHPNKVNTGQYTPSDTVFVSVPGKRGGPSAYQPNIDNTIIEVQKALDGGAVVITDNVNYTESSNYNVGEKQLKVYLEKQRIPYTEITDNGITVGVWGPIGDPLDAERANDLANEEPDVPEVRRTYSGKITDLKENEMMLFGSNPEGRHGKGAAKDAMKFGAVRGKGRGIMQQTYGIVTKNLTPGFTEKSTGYVYPKAGAKSVSKARIIEQIKQSYEDLGRDDETDVLVAYGTETNLNGYTPQDMADMFNEAAEDIGGIPDNFIFNEEFAKLLEDDKATRVDPNQTSLFDGQDTGLFPDSDSQVDPTDGIRAIDPNEDDMKPMFALDGTAFTEQMSEQIETLLKAFLDNNGISVTIIENMKARFGLDVSGVADAMNKAIFLAKGDKGLSSMPEEVAHIYIETTLGSPRTEAMIAAVDGTPEFAEVKEAYGEAYGNDDYRLRREAAAKILAKRLLDPKTSIQQNDSTLNGLIRRFLNFIKKHFGRIDVFHIPANEILMGSILVPTNKKSPTMFNIDEDTSIDPDNVPLDQIPDPNDEDVAKDISAAQASEIKQKEIMDEYGFTEQEVEFAMSDAHRAITNVSDAVLSIGVSLKRKINRLKKSGKDKESIADIERIYKQLNQAVDINTLIKYVDEIANKVEVQRKQFDFLREQGLLTNEALMAMDAELKSYDNLKYVSQYMAKSVRGDSDLVKGMHEAIGKVMYEKSRIQDDISVEIVETTSEILHALTSQKLSIDQVIRQMNIAPKDVSFISKWIRPGADSSDLLVRMTQKMINDAKQYAWMEFIDMYRGPLGLEQANKDYEDYLAKEGNLNSDMQQRNEPFIVKEDDGWYLVNPENGKEKYDALMALPATDPRRRYYDTLEQMYMSTQDETSNIRGKRPFGYKLPSARKENAERILGADSNNTNGNKYARSMKELILDTFVVRGDDNEEGLISREKYDRDENNEIVKDVPLFFTSNMDADDVSLDIATTIGASVKNMLEYNRLNKYKPTLWAIERIAEEREVAQTETANSFVGKISQKINKLGQVDTEKGHDSNAAHQIRMIKDQHYYGETDEKSVIFTFGGKEYTWNKLSKVISKIASAKIMILNPKIAISNAFTGEAMMLQEAISGRYFNMADWRKGGALLASNYGQMVAELYSRKKYSKMGGLIEFLNLDNNFQTAHQKLGMKGSFAGNMYEGFMSSTRIMQNIGQIAVDIQSIGAVSNNIKVQDADGNDMTFYEAFDMVDGAMKMKEGLTYEGKPLDNGDGTGQMYMLRERIIKIQESMHGVYNRLDAPAFAAKVVGQQVMFMRGWLFSQIARRFDKTRFQERLGEYDEGTYTSMFKIVNNVFGENGPIGLAAKFKLLMTTGKPVDVLLTQEERDMFAANDDQEGQDKLVHARTANVKKGWMELSMIAGMYILGLMIFDDDEEKGGVGYEMAKYQYFRLQRELFFYNPSDMAEIMKNPAINISVVTDALGIAYMTMNVPEWGAEVSSGAHKGDNKLWNRTRKYVPGWNHWKSLEDLDRATDAIKNNYR